MKIETLAAAAALLCAPLSAHALVGLEVGARGSYWAPRLTGNLGADGTADVDVQDDLNLDDGLDKGLPGVEVFAWIGDHQLSVAGQRADYEGDASLKYTQYEGTYQWNLVDLENWIAGTSFGPVLHAKYFDGEAGDGSGTVDFKMTVPMVGLGAHVGILADFLEVRARGLWMGYQGNSAVDAWGEVMMSPFPFTDLAVGYRYLKLDVDAADMPGSSGDLVFDTVQQGPYVSLTIKLGL